MINIIFLFAPDVWGTVSDWAMVIVTAITALYLFKTFQSQKEVQKTQTELFKIESIRFRESIKPKFHYEEAPNQMHSPDEKKEIISIAITNLSDSQAVELVPDYANNANQIVAHPSNKHLVKGDRPIILHFLVDHSKRGDSFIVFGINYKDVAGTKYRQRVWLMKDSRGLFINPSLPELIDNVIDAESEVLAVNN